MEREALAQGDVLVVDLVVTCAYCTLMLTVAVLLVRFGSGVAAVVAAVCAADEVFVSADPRYCVLLEE